MKWTLFAMMNQEKWLNRTWQFGQNEDCFDSIVESLSQTPGVIQNLIRDSDTGLLIHKSESAWSVNEHIGHLLTMESLWIARLDDFVMKNATLRPWNGHNQDTDAGQFNSQRASKILEDFADIRQAHLNLLSKYSEKRTSMTAFHERLGQIFTLCDHLMFMLEHDRHHLQTITHLL